MPCVAGRVIMRRTRVRQLRLTVRTRRRRVSMACTVPCVLSRRAAGASRCRTCTTPPPAQTITPGTTRACTTTTGGATAAGVPAAAPPQQMALWEARTPSRTPIAVTFSPPYNISSTILTGFGECSVVFANQPLCT